MSFYALHDTTALRRPLEPGEYLPINELDMQIKHERLRPTG
jgi:hypothetical protein